MPFEMKKLPITEYRKMQRYYVKYREQLDNPSSDDEMFDGRVIE